MKAVVGLGNPGKQYEWTRHNAGFLAVDHFSKAFKVPAFAHSKSGTFQFACARQEAQEFVVIKPVLFMNESGCAIQAALNEFSVGIQDCLIVADDVNLPLGTLRLRTQGSAGGHHGLESVIEQLGTSNFPRLRIGVGAGDLSGKDLTGFVLEPFLEPERDQILLQIERASEACREWIRNGSEAVMRRFN